MANRKQPYSWNRVKPGDIISFRYKSKRKGTTRTHSVLVLNPKLNVTLKDGFVTKHLVGVKLEESNRMSLTLDKREVSLLERIGNFRQIKFISCVNILFSKSCLVYYVLQGPFKNN